MRAPSGGGGKEESREKGKSEFQHHRCGDTGDRHDGADTQIDSSGEMIAVSEQNSAAQIGVEVQLAVRSGERLIHRHVESVAYREFMDVDVKAECVYRLLQRIELPADVCEIVSCLEDIHVRSYHAE